MSAARNDDQTAVGRVRRPVARVVLSILAVVTLVNVVIFVAVPRLLRQSALGEATRSSLMVADQIKITRAYYTENVLAKILATGVLHPAWDHVRDPLAVPLPAAFIQDLSMLLARQETRLKLVSPWPWPNRRERTMDAFEVAAWNGFVDNPDAIATELAEIDGQQVLRIAVPDRMSSQTCLGCHNADPKSPKTDWKLGDLRAVMEVNRVVDGVLAAADREGRAIAVTIGLGLYGIGVLAAILAVLGRRRADEKAATDATIHRMAFRDALSDLLNRKGFLDSFAARCRSGAPDETVALYFIDVDRFKSINDTHGHDGGDTVLREVADRLRAACGPDTLVGRLGGDEFVLARWGRIDEATAMAMAAAFVVDVARPIAIGARALTATASIGIALAPAATALPEHMLEEADIALYEAKEAGRNRGVLYDDRLRQRQLRQRQIEARVRQAAEEGGFELVFQPICHSNGVDLWGFEALARLSLEGTNDAIPPAQFIGIAETLGLIPRVGAWIIREAVRQAARWPDHLVVSVNLSALQFASAATEGLDLVAITRDALQAQGVPARRLEYEITESLYLHADPVVLDQLAALRDMGVKIALDDFGTGYATLAYLWKFPFSKMKIDCSFVEAINDINANANTVIAATVTLGHALGMTVTAEGVEDIRQVEFLRLLGCDLFQGFLFGKPRPGEETLALIAAGGKWYRPSAVDAAAGDPDRPHRAIVA